MRRAEMGGERTKIYKLWVCVKDKSSFFFLLLHNTDIKKRGKCETVEVGCTITDVFYQKQN